MLKAKWWHRSFWNLRTARIPESGVLPGEAIDYRAGHLENKRREIKFSKKIAQRLPNNWGITTNLLWGSGWSQTIENRWTFFATERESFSRELAFTDCECFFAHRKQDLSLSVYVDDVKMIGTMQNTVRIVEQVDEERWSWWTNFISWSPWMSSSSRCYKRQVHPDATSDDQLYCCNPDWMRNGGLTLWNVLAICDTLKILKYGPKWEKPLKIEKSYSGQSRHQNSTTLEGWEAFISLIVKMANFKKQSKMRGEGWKSQRMRQCRARKEQQRQFVASGNWSEKLWIPQSTRQRLQSSLPKDHEDHIAGKGKNCGCESSSRQGMEETQNDSSLAVGQGKEQKGCYSGSTERQRESPLCNIDGHVSSQKCGVRTKFTKVQKDESCSEVIWWKTILVLMQYSQSKVRLRHQWQQQK